MRSLIKRFTFFFYKLLLCPFTTQECGFWASICNTFTLPPIIYAHTQKTYTSDLRSRPKQRSLSWMQRKSTRHNSHVPLMSLHKNGHCTKTQLGSYAKSTVTTMSWFTFIPMSVPFLEKFRYKFFWLNFKLIKPQGSNDTNYWGNPLLKKMKE